MSRDADGAEFGRALRRVGIGQRVTISLLTAPLVVAAAIAVGEGISVIASIVVISPFLLAFALSWRIRVKVSPDSLTVRSYFTTTTIPFSDIVAVDDVGYEGFWNRYNRAPDGWLGFGMRMLEVDRRNQGDKQFPATLCGRTTARVLATELTRRAQRLDAPRTTRT